LLAKEREDQKAAKVLPFTCLARSKRLQHHVHDDAMGTMTARVASINTRPTTLMSSWTSRSSRSSWRCRGPSP